VAAVSPIETSPAAQSPANGAEELAIAQRYLNGSNGQKRDASLAAEWLWKAFAKQNEDAAVLLSDLYLKGDGVAKNCDQARVLLNAAARKGRKDATDRLSQMQSSGCE
jgi:TPR repeat protein